jgi:phage tail sheath protein FI
MAEQTFRSPGFFEQEIELVAGAIEPTGIPVGVIGAAEKGPAFVPVTVPNFTSFQSRFGGTDPALPAIYAVREALRHKQALTFVRVLGAGANSTSGDISTTQTDGTVKNAGFKVTSNTSDNAVARLDGAVTFIAAKHHISASGGPREEIGFPIFTDNPSFDVAEGSATTINLVRAVIFPASGSRVVTLGYDQTWSNTANDSGYLGLETDTSGLAKKFKLAISSSAGTAFANDDGFAGVRILTASLNPSDTTYISKILNTDPDLFASQKHLLYLDFPIEDEIAPVIVGATGNRTVAALVGNSTWQDTFGRFDTRYTTPRTPAIISQPFGTQEYDLFHFETISDGEYSNSQFKVSIANVQASTDEARPYGTFDVILRRFADDDITPQVIEQYARCTLDPTADNYIAKMIGDRKVYYNFDTDDRNERRLIISGRFPNRSINFRVVMNSAVENRQVPAKCLPFGFRGIPVIKTSDSLKDTGGLLTFAGMSFSGDTRLSGSMGASVTNAITGSIIPPLPFRFKVTRGELGQVDPNIGAPGTNERSDSRFYWGVVTKRLPQTGSQENAILNPNAGTLENELVRSYTKFHGISKLGTLITGSGADVFNANKFTMARVALANASLSTVTGTADVHMKEAAYIRNGTPNGVDYTVTVGGSSRVTMATLVASSSIIFNRFSPFNKFTTVFYGGFNGLNVLDRDNRNMTDRAASTEASVAAIGSGKASGDIEVGLKQNAAGIGKDNNVIAAYRAATDILTDEFSSNVNVLAIPGIRDSFVTTYAGDAVKNFSKAMFIRDIPSYDDSGNRLWIDSTVRTNVRSTTETFTGLSIDNNYVATYFPDVYVQDEVLNRRVKVPASIAALGAISYNDRVSYPWFAPAGFNRAALDFVNNASVRLSQLDRDTLYDARINPIASFPQGGFVIFGQKTLQLATTALNRVNVRRLLLEVKRVVSSVANSLLFEQNNSTTRSRFVTGVSPQLSLIQAQAGIERFRVVCDATNNTDADVEANRMNGRIVIVPTKTVEFVAIDFVITPAGVQFP